MRIGMMLVGGLLLVHTPSFADEARLNLQNIGSWGYQLQNTSLLQIRKSDFDLVVMEPTLASDATRYFTRSQVQLMKNGRHVTKSKVLLAYLSIGEAENYRKYWNVSWKKNPPSWLGVENPDWKGNYKVRYWEPEWQKLMLEGVDQILKAGFDGVYLDIVDAYAYWADQDMYYQNEKGEEGGKEIRQQGDPYNDEEKSGSWMAEWIHRIAEHSRKKSTFANPKFLVFPQNGEGLLDQVSQPLQNQYWEDIDGIGVEDLFHLGDNEEDNPRNVEKERLKFLHEFPKRGKLVLNVEYISNGALVQKFYQDAQKWHFLPYTAKRGLDRLSEPR